MNPDRLDSLIMALVERLRDGQREDGSFPILRRFMGAVESYVEPSEFPEWHSFGWCPFATATIALHLRDIDLPGVAEIRRRACLSLVDCMENGVARYVPAKAKPIDFPPDVDDTCLVAAALEANGFASGCNRAMLRDNHGGDGNMYTWLVPRWRHLRHPRNFTWLVKDRREWKARFSSYGLPADHVELMTREYDREDDPGVTANVLLVLGDMALTRTMLRKMIERVAAGDGARGYYSNLAVVYFHIARMYRHGIRQVASLKPMIIAYLHGLQRADGEIDGPFNTALGALTYMYFDCWRLPQLEAAVGYLACHAMHRSRWEPFHYCNDPNHTFQDGAADLTKLFYLEALYRYRAAEEERGQVCTSSMKQRSQPR